MASPDTIIVDYHAASEGGGARPPCSLAHAAGHPVQFVMSSTQPVVVISALPDTRLTRSSIVRYR